MELTVTGMTCGHCEAAVRRAVQAVAPQAGVTIDRAAGWVAITGAEEAEAVIRAIRAEGYEVSAGA